MKQILKCYYRRNLKMSAGKLAAQIGHLVYNITRMHEPDIGKIIVLKASDTRFCNVASDLAMTGRDYYIQKDLGLTEVEEDTETVLGYLYEEET